MLLTCFHVQEVVEALSLLRAVNLKYRFRFLEPGSFDNRVGLLIHLAGQMEAKLCFVEQEVLGSFGFVAFASERIDILTQPVG